MDSKIHALAVEIYSHPEWSQSRAQVKALSFLETLKMWDTDCPGIHYRLGYVSEEEVVWWEHPHVDFSRRVAITEDTIEIQECLNGELFHTARKVF